MGALRNRYPLTVTPIYFRGCSHQNSIVRGIPFECDKFKWETKIMFDSYNGYKYIEIYVEEIYPNSLLNGVIINNVLVHDENGCTFNYLNGSQHFHFNVEKTKYRTPLVKIINGTIRLTFDIIANPFLKLSKGYPDQNGFPLKDMYASKEFTDVTIKVYDDSEKYAEDIAVGSKRKISDLRDRKPASFTAHRVVISAASSFFRQALTDGRRNPPKDTISLYEVNSLLFEKVLKFCYTYSIDIRDYKEGCALLKLNDFLKVKRLSDIIIIELLKVIDSTNIWHICLTAVHYSKNLKDTCKMFLANASGSVFDGESWLDSSPAVIKLILKHKYVPKVTEEVLYKAVVRWIDHKRDIVSRQHRRHEESSDFPTSFNGCLYANEKDLEKDATDLMKLIKFNMIPIRIIKTDIRTNAFIMSLPGIKELIETLFDRLSSQSFYTGFDCILDYE